MTKVHFRSAGHRLWRKAFARARSASRRSAGTFSLAGRPPGSGVEHDIQRTARARANAPMRRTRRAHAAIRLGVLHGVPMTIKESYDSQGSPAPGASGNGEEHRGHGYALAVTRLADEGANVFGKTNVRTPCSRTSRVQRRLWRDGTIPRITRARRAGSSGGSAAALAAGLTGLEIGSDIGGSIRKTPYIIAASSDCDKPTWNLAPPRGHALGGIVAQTDISVIGPLARSAFDLETALRLMAQPDEFEADGRTARRSPDALSGRCRTAHRRVENGRVLSGIESRERPR